MVSKHVAGEMGKVVVGGGLVEMGSGQPDGGGLGRAGFSVLERNIPKEMLLLWMEVVKDLLQFVLILSQRKVLFAARSRGRVIDGVGKSKRLGA